MRREPLPLGEALRERYLVERELGQGGMATVYLARDLKQERLVALKVLHPEIAATLGPERFLREIRLASRLQHPHILPVFDSGEAAGKVWYVMPYVEGESLRDRLRREIQLSMDEALRTALQVASALDYAHRHGVVHRDIKPENILLADEQALVADFGVARALGASAGERLTETGVVLGTPSYMSPEQASGTSQVDGRSDIYSLGCVLYEMLAGEPPYTGPTPQLVLAKRVLGHVPSIRRVRPTIPSAIEALITRTLAQVPADRFASAAVLAAALDHLEAGERAAEPGEHNTGATPEGRRRLAPRAALAALVMLLLAGAGYEATGRPSHLRASIGGDTGLELRATRQLVTSRARSVAVLPLATIGGDSSIGDFSDGLTDELASALGKIPELRVASRSSAFALEGQALGAREVGQRLHVDAVLEGRVRRAGSKLRVTAQLVDARDGLALWSETYERDVEDVFRTQDDIAQAVLGAIGPKVAGLRRDAEPGYASAWQSSGSLSPSP